MWKVKKSYFGTCSEGYIGTECEVVKVRIIIYHCCVILLRFDNFFLSVNINHLALIRVKIWGLHKKSYPGAIPRIPLSPELELLKWLQG